jgi:hypothetical protein
MQKKTMPAERPRQAQHCARKEHMGCGGLKEELATPENKGKGRVQRNFWTASE